MLKTYKYRIYPTESQKTLLAKTFGCCRFVYNRALSIKMALYQTEKKGISVFQLTNDMAKWKDQEETSWLKEVNSQALQMSLRHLDIAYTRFFREKKGFPKFKNKSSRNAFCNPQSTKIVDDKLVIPKFKDGIKIVLHRELKGEIRSSTISKTPTNKYFVSILTEDHEVEPKVRKAVETKTLGIDLGLTNYLTDSTGKVVANPRHLKKKLRALKRAQRRLSRKKKGSKNRDKQKIRVARIYEKVTNCRKDFLHKLTKKLVENQNYNSIAMENLDVAGLLRTKKLSRHIADAGWGEFRSLLEYKSKWYGKNLLFIGRFDPSSKLCPCGNLADLTLKDRIWTCEKCGETHKRDELAARNIKRFAFCHQNTSKFLVPQELRKPGRKIKSPVESKVTKTMKQEASNPLG